MKSNIYRVRKEKNKTHTRYLHVMDSWTVKLVTNTVDGKPKSRLPSRFWSTTVGIWNSWGCKIPNMVCVCVCASVCVLFCVFVSICAHMAQACCQDDLQLNTLKGAAASRRLAARNWDTKQRLRWKAPPLAFNRCLCARLVKPPFLKKDLAMVTAAPWPQSPHTLLTQPVLCC